VVGQQHEVGGAAVGHPAGDRDRRAKVGVTPDALVEDDQIERGGQEPAEPDQRVGHVDQGGEYREDRHAAQMMAQVSGG
jgi:hypothetical protein